MSLTSQQAEHLGLLSDVFILFFIFGPGIVELGGLDRPDHQTRRFPSGPKTQKHLEKRAEQGQHPVLGASAPRVYMPPWHLGTSPSSDIPPPGEGPDSHLLQGNNGFGPISARIRGG